MACAGAGQEGDSRLSLLDLTLNEFLIYVLVLIRMAGLVVFAPFFGGENLPQRARIGLIALLAFLVFPAAAKTFSEAPLSLVDLGVLGLREALVGIALGFGASLVFAGAQLAGQLVGQQLGFALANVVDPMTDQQVGLISFFNFMLALVVFLGLNLHLLLLRVLAMSYDLVGLGEAVLNPDFMDDGYGGGLLVMFGHIWENTVQIGGPVLAIMLMVSTVVGFLVRTMPQMNIMVVGLPSRSILGLLALSLVIRPFVETVGVLSEEMIRDVQLLLRYMAPPA
jgi:flagellar biosynthesis protein FliR